MDLLRKGRARAEFESFAALHADALLRNAYLMAGDRGEAEDLVQDLPATEVALILDCSPGTVKSSTSRGLERLREALDPSAPLSTADDVSPR